MNDREFRNRLNQDLPDAPEIFHRAMTDPLKTIVREEGKRRAACPVFYRSRLLNALPHRITAGRCLHRPAAQSAVIPSL